MSWSFTVPGQPVTFDHAYKTGKLALKRGGRPVFNEDMTQRFVHRPILTEEAKTWRDSIQMLARLAKPSRWKPSEQLAVTIDLRLAHDIDADNVLKLILDGLALGIDYNDRHFLPCVRSKTTGRTVAQACVIITVEEIP